MKVIEQSHKILALLDYHSIIEAIEIAGRTAYKSEHKMTPLSAETFVASIIARGHESVLEHQSISVRFITDRGVTHELVRHRIAAYTQESTRYCNYAGKDILFIKPVFWANNSSSMSVWQASMLDAEERYNNLIFMGCTPQEARTVLPNSLKTEIVCTANIREWRHILQLRTAKSAHPQMSTLMIPLLQELQEKLPVLFSDIKVES